MFSFPRGGSSEDIICVCLPKISLASRNRGFTHLVFIKSSCQAIYMLEISSSSSCKTLTLTIIEEVSAGVFISITCHLKYDSAVTARPWGCLCVGTAI